jgi:hypothetical protein
VLQHCDLVWLVGASLSEKCTASIFRVDFRDNWNTKGCVIFCVVTQKVTV